MATNHHIFLKLLGIIGIILLILFLGIGGIVGGILTIGHASITGVGYGLGFFKIFMGILVLIGGTLFLVITGTVKLIKTLIKELYK